MRKTILLVSLLATGVLAGCMEGGIDAKCTALGAGAGAVVGAATNNNLAQSAIVGGVLGAVAADQGMCN